MSSDVESTLREAFRGRSCRVVRREFDWAFDFGDGRTLATASPWRIVVDGQIAFAGSDDGHRFGHSAPVDGARLANVLLAWRRLDGVKLDPTTADLSLLFGGPRVDVFNASSGYEAWQADWTSGSESKVVIGRGGGGLSGSFE